MGRKGSKKWVLPPSEERRKWIGTAEERISVWKRKWSEVPGATKSMVWYEAEDMVDDSDEESPADMESMSAEWSVSRFALTIKLAGFDPQDYTTYVAGRPVQVRPFVLYFCFFFAHVLFLFLCQLPCIEPFAICMGGSPELPLYIVSVTSCSRLSC